MQSTDLPLHAIASLERVTPGYISRLLRLPLVESNIGRIDFAAAIFRASVFRSRAPTGRRVDEPGFGARGNLASKLYSLTHGPNLTTSAQSQKRKAGPQTAGLSPTER